MRGYSKNTVYKTFRVRSELTKIIGAMSFARSKILVASKRLQSGKFQLSPPQCLENSSFIISSSSVFQIHCNLVLDTNLRRTKNFSQLKKNVEGPPSSMLMYCSQSRGEILVMAEGKSWKRSLPSTATTLNASGRLRLLFSAGEKKDSFPKSGKPSYFYDFIIKTKRSIDKTAHAN